MLASGLFVIDQSAINDVTVWKALRTEQLPRRQESQSDVFDQVGFTADGHQSKAIMSGDGR
jgi:hypothetical protein